jgi:hypothetical protein
MRGARQTSRSISGERLVLRPAANLGQMASLPCVGLAGLPRRHGPRSKHVKAGLTHELGVAVGLSARVDTKSQYPIQGILRAPYEAEQSLRTATPLEHFLYQARVRRLALRFFQAQRYRRLDGLDIVIHESLLSVLCPADSIYRRGWAFIGRLDSPTLAERRVQPPGQPDRLRSALRG